MAQSLRSKHDWQLTKCSIKDRFEELRKLSQWTDCTFSVGYDNVEIIYCHKLVLAASSPVFEALFFGGLSDSSEVIKIPDVEPRIFNLFLNYIYSDSLNLQNVNDTVGLLYVAKKYMLPSLSEACLEYLIENTSICTLWEMLEVAEALHEEELIAGCLKVMSRYSYEIWATNTDDHLSENMLLRLLDQHQMNMKEIDLFRFILYWAERQYLSKGHPISPHVIRSHLSSIGALSKIRFLLLSQNEFTETVEPSGILTEDECSLFKSLLGEKDKEADILDRVPLGFSSSTDRRNTITPLTWRCTREMVRGGRFCVHTGPVKVGITSNSRVLVTGFEFVTRISTVSGGPHCNYSYRERLMVLVKDQNGQVLCSCKHEQNVDFNSFQIVLLSRPIWFEPGVKYSVGLDFSTGQYALPYYAEMTLGKGTSFQFDDSYLRGISFVHSILYSY